MAVKNATYKVDNGAGFDEIMFKTLARQVLFKNGVNLEEGMANSLGENGYHKFPSGLILQWGKIYIPPTSGYGVYGAFITYPIAFTTEVYNVHVGLSFNYSDSVNIITSATEAYDARTLTRSGYRYRIDGSIVNNNDVYIYWFALGR